MTVGKSYKITITVSEYVSGSVEVSAGASPRGSMNANGTYTFTQTATPNTSFYIISQVFNGAVDNVSVVEITGDRARLNYEIEGGLVNTKPSLLLEPQSTNLITYSEDFSQWLLDGSQSSPTTTTGTNPDGSSQVYQIELNSGGNTKPSLLLEPQSTNPVSYTHLTLPTK